MTSHLQTPETASIQFRKVDGVSGAESKVATNSSIYWRVFHERYSVGIFDSVASDWHYRGKRRFVTDRGIILIEPGETHFHTSMLKPASFRVLLFDSELFESVAQEAGMNGAPHLRLAQDYDPDTFRAFHRLHESIYRSESPLEQQSRLIYCLHLLLGARYSERATSEVDGEKNPRAARIAEAYIREHFNQSINLEQLSRVAGVSRFYLLRTFAKCFGLPPHAYQNSLRLARGQTLIRLGSTMAAAATTVGFSDQSHFARLYKKTYGVTPSQYASMIR